MSLTVTGNGEPPALVTMAADTWAEHLAARERLKQRVVELEIGQDRRDELVAWLNKEVAKAERYGVKQAEQQLAGQRWMVAHLRDRLKRCQEHNRQAETRVREAADYQMESMHAWTDQLVEVVKRAEQAEAERNEARGEAAMAMAECDAMQFRLTQVGRERDAARAGLGRLRNGIAEASICLTEPLDMLPCLTPERRIKAAAGTLESLLADPQGQQAAVEWQRLQRIEQATQRYFLGNCGDSFADWAAVRQLHGELLAEVLAALQQPPAAGEKKDG